MGATESFSDIDLSLDSGELGGMMGVANDDNKIDALYQYETIVLKVKVFKILCALQCFSHLPVEDEAQPTNLSFILVM